MNEVARRTAAKRFVQDWKNKGYEKGQSQPFWLQLLGEVFGVEHPAQFISFENQVMLDHTSFIDGYIEETGVLIEQKSLGKDLLAPIQQADGTWLKPIEQAKRYMLGLPVSKHPKYIVTCNFEKFLVYDMERPHSEPEEILLENLEVDYYRLNFLVNNKSVHLHKEMQVSMAAGELVGKLYEAFLEQYKDPNNEESLKSLNKLCVRLVFCLYAEDAGIFGEHDMFHNYLHGFDTKHMRGALIELFRILNQKPEERDPYLEDSLSAFPYVNGGLFADDNIEIPQFTDEIRELLLTQGALNFDWSEISPTIFGAVFESTLNPDTRRSGGMHYTSIENIHKVIDPLFLNELTDEFIKIKNLKKKRKEHLQNFQKKLARLSFLDPACGSGNFLTETFISLRKLENEVIRLLYGGEMVLGEIFDPIQVSISQFYGIEINDFAVSVATTALWIAESQMMKATEDIVHMPLDFLPLKTYSHIHEGNALRMDWNDVVAKDKLNYIMGNPPFVGAMMMNGKQRNELANVFPECKKVGEIDYVVGWYAVATEYIQQTDIKCAFVSTNSICQGQSVAAVWKPIFNKNIQIHFAYRTFIWNSEANLKAHVHCVIIGFSASKKIKKKLIFDGMRIMEVKNINPYLVDAETVFIENMSQPLCNVPTIRFGSMPRDGGGFILDEEDVIKLAKKEPLASKWIRLYLGANEFLKGKKRWCLWLKGASPREIQSCPTVLARVNEVKQFRLSSKAAGTRKFAEIPHLFCQIAQPEYGDYIAVPKTSSERRRYLPIGFLSSEVIASDLLFLIPNANYYHFGVLTSNVHMAWMRAVAGRLKSDYRYSKDIVYNNFPWPESSDVQKAKIEQTAQLILKARQLYPDSSLADLYDEATMPIELRKAHRANDRAVMEAYGFDVKNMTESMCVAELMRLYQNLVSKQKK